MSGPVPGDASTVHYLPCKIDFSGRARVNTFFLVERDGAAAPRFGFESPFAARPLREPITVERRTLPRTNV